MSARTRQLNRIEAALAGLEDALAALSDAVRLDTPGGLAVVVSEAKDARTAAESAFVGVQALASQATAKPGLPEVVEAVSAHTNALRAMDAAVRAATGPQPALPAPDPDPGPGPALKAAAAKGAAAKGMGSRVPAKTRGGKP